MALSNCTMQFKRCQAANSEKVMRVTLAVKEQVQGYHHWPKATENLAFLASRHRHTFIIRGFATVQELDREKEFCEIKWKIRESLSRFKTVNSEYDFGSMSCEMIALYICEACGLTACEVSEDEEFYAKVEM